MQFTVTERIKTKKDKEAILEELTDVFQKISAKVTEGKKGITAKTINATFGSINRTDVTEVTLKEKENGYLLSADVTYKPSVAFWVYLIILLFTWVGWIFPIAFYLWHRGLVKSGIEKAFKNIRDEFED